MTPSHSSSTLQYSTRRHVSWTPETSPSLSETSDDSDTTPSPLSKPETMISNPAPSTSSQSRLSPPTTSSSGPSIHPYRPQPTRTPSISPPKVNLPKSQPLSRALFARMAMAEIPHAGMSNAGAVKKAGGGGKQKMIVATKPMRTTFELGLTSSELARRQ